MGQFNSSNNPPPSPRDRGSHGGHGGRGDRLRTAIFFPPSGPSPAPDHPHQHQQIQEPEFCIKFPDIAHASAYADLISRRGRKTHVTRTGRSVYMKLPESVRRLERRESLGGFVFSFRSSGGAYDWEDDLFRMVDHRDTKRPPTEVVLREKWRPGELDSIFGVNTHHSSAHGYMSGAARPRSSHAAMNEKEGHRERDRDRDRDRSVRPRSSHHGEMREKGSRSPPRQSRPSSRISQAKY
ncbi:hypothetical protein V8F33_007355 [Rhypophila sp. PSN 637]